MERRLAAILAVDVVGFSRLMECDEAGTLAISPVTKSLSDHPISGALTTTSMAIWPSTVAINTSASVSSV